MTFKEKYIGPMSFYRKSFSIAIPLALQMLLGSCMSIVDTMMVASINMVSAVGNAMQVLVLYEAVGWGIIAGISMFASQFYGANNEKNLKRVFGLSLLLTLSIASIWIIVASIFGDKILYFYLPDNNVLPYSLDYLKVAIFSIIPVALNNSFNSLYRSIHKANIGLRVSIVGAISNVVLNALFIYYFNLGVVGAALGTLLAQLIVTSIYIIYTLKTKQVFVGNIEEMFHLSSDFIRPIVRKMFPLILNETLFGFGLTLFIKAFGTLGTTSMEAYYIANQIYNMFLFVVNGLGGSVSIIVGTRLGQGLLEQAKQESNYQLFLGFILATFLICLMLILSDPLLTLFSISDNNIYKLAKGCVYALSFKVFFRVFNFMMFSTLRAGGDSKILSLLDAGLMYTIGISLAFFSVNILDINNIIMVLFIVQIEQFIRMILTYKRYKSYKWVNDLTLLIK